MSHTFVHAPYCPDITHKAQPPSWNVRRRFKIAVSHTQSQTRFSDRSITCFLCAGRTTPSPYYFNANQTQDTGPERRRFLLYRWPGVMLLVVVFVIVTVIVVAFCVYWALKCRLLHDQIAYDGTKIGLKTVANVGALPLMVQKLADQPPKVCNMLEKNQIQPRKLTFTEKHKFMEEHGEMPSAGPVITGVRPPQDGWKYVTKSPYMLTDEMAASPGEKEPHRVRTWGLLVSRARVRRHWKLLGKRHQNSPERGY